MGRAVILFALITGAFPMMLIVPGQRFFEFVGGINAQALYLFIITVLLLSVLTLDIEKTISKAMSYFWFFLFILFCIISFTWTQDTVFGLRMLVKLLAPFLFLIGILVYFGSEDTAKSERFIIFLAVVVLLLGVFNLLSQGALGPLKGTKGWGGGDVLSAPYMSPANFSFFMGTVALISLANFICVRKMIFFILYVAFSGAVLWAYTRISMAGLLIGSAMLVFMLLKSTMTRIIIPSTMAVLLLVSVFTVDSIRSRMFFNAQEISLSTALSNPNTLAESINTSGRTYLWGEAYKHFKHSSEITGAGIGSVDKWLESFRRTDALHSEFIRLYFELGMLGLLFYVMALIQMYSISFRIYRNYDDKTTQKYSSIAVAVLSFYVITLITDNSLNYVTEFGMYVFATQGLAMVAANRIANLKQEKR